MKEYNTPEIRTEEIKIGIFGTYGCPRKRGRKRRRRRRRLHSWWRLAFLK